MNNKPQYSLGFEGVDEYNRSLIETMLRSVAPFMDCTWQMAQTGDADVTICGLGIPAGSGRKNLVLQLVNETETTGRTEELTLPLRLMGFLESLKHAEKMLRGNIIDAAAAQPQAAATAAAEPSVPQDGRPAQSWQTFALELLRGVTGEKQGQMKFKIGDLPIAVADVQNDTVFAAFELSDLPRTEVVVRHAWLDAPVESTVTPQSLDILHWQVGMRSAPGNCAPWIKRNGRYRLKYWPNLAVLPHSLGQMNVAARLANVACSIDEIIRLGKLPENEVFNIFNAFGVMGLLQEETLERPKYVIVSDPAEQKRSNVVSSIIGRLFGKRAG
jgi:hypothetical protein